MNEAERSNDRAVGAMLRRDVPPSRLLDHARALAGFDELWVVEDLPYAGGIAQMATVLDATAGDDGSGPLIGHGIAPAPFRNPAALAMEWAALAEMYPGRVAGGIGHGVPSWMAQIGEAVDSPLTLLEETIQVTQQLLAGERVTADGRYVQVDSVELVFPPATPPLVSAGVMGPRSLELSGRVAGGTILPEGHGVDRITAALERIAAGADAGDRDSSVHRLTVFAGFYCGDLTELGPPPPDSPEGWAAVAEHPDDCAEELASLFDAGADAIVLVPFGDDVDEQLGRAREEIVPLLRA